GEMAQDLRRFVQRFAIVARRAGPLAPALKWARRQPGPGGALAAMLLALAGAGFFAVQGQQGPDPLTGRHAPAAPGAALLAAVSGDEEAPLLAINRAEERGASPGQLNLLRGLVKHQGGRPREALAHLEQADRQLPRSVAVKALLAQAHQDDGRFDRFDEVA